MERFLKGRTEKLVIVDLEELKFTGISEEFQYILSPVIFPVLWREDTVGIWKNTVVMIYQYADITGSLNIRKKENPMRKVFFLI